MDIKKFTLKINIKKGKQKTKTEEKEWKQRKALNNSNLKQVSNLKLLLIVFQL